MKFTGQVRIPEVDHPGVPATIVVEDDQTEVFLEGESLGRWSLYDVQASRLVSAAFSISLAGEEITFIADEPVDFAYRGVDHMASVWARYKSMTIPRRVVAVGRSRRGATPSRIAELREAMLQNLEAAGRATTIRPIESVRESPDVVSGWSKRLEAYSNVPAPIEDVAEPPTAAKVTRPRFAEEAAEPGEAEQVAPPVIEVVAADDRVAAVIEPTPPEPPEGRAQTPSPIEPAPGVPAPPQDREPTPPAPRLRPGPGLVRRRTVRGPEPVPESSRDRVEPPHEEPAIEPETKTGAAKTEEPRPELVVDLGRLEDGGDQGGAEEPAAEQPASDLGKEPVLAGAPSAPAPGGERSGLLGAVRSAFARNRTAHVHEFVEAPGGIGIVRQICSECGYISIGVSD